MTKSRMSDLLDRGILVIYSFSMYKSQMSDNSVQGDTSGLETGLGWLEFSAIETFGGPVGWDYGEISFSNIWC